jgi:hypothetical protein
VKKYKLIKKFIGKYNQLLHSHPVKVLPYTLILALSCAFIGISSTRSQAQDNFLTNGGFEDWEPASDNVNQLLKKFGTELPGGEVPVAWTVGQSIRDGSDTPPETFSLFARDEEVKKEGLYSLRIEKNNNLYAMGASSRKQYWNPSPFELPPGKSYVLRGWIKGENLESSESSPGNVRVIIAKGPEGFFSAGTERRNVWAKLPEVGTFDDWTEFELRFDMKPEETACYLALELVKPLTGKIWLDGLVLTQE